MDMILLSMAPRPTNMAKDQSYHLAYQMIRFGPKSLGIARGLPMLPLTRYG